MPVHSPIQTSFAGGEITPRARGHVGTDLYARSLSLCRNWRPLPHGSLLMRAGSRDRGLFADVLRVIPFNAVGGAPYSILLSSSEVTGYLRILDADGNIVPLFNNLINNGTFHSGLVTGTASGTGWGDDVPTVAGACSPRWDSGGFAHLTDGQWVSQRKLLTGGAAYTLRFRAKSPDGGTADVYVKRSGVEEYALVRSFPALTASWQNFSFPVTPGVGDNYYLNLAAPVGKTVDYDDVVLTLDTDLGGWDGSGLDQKITTPWKTADIPLVQFDQDNAKNMMVLTGPAGLRTLTLTSHGLWFLKNAPWINKPPEWVDGNYPATVELGYQGRLWLAGAPDQPNTFKASKSGAPFDFTTGANAADSMSWNASLRGAITWIRGHLSLLIGSENSEQSANGNGALIAPANPPDVRDESVFGSAKFQPALAGDEVLFVSKDRNAIRTLSFDALTKNGWVSAPVSFFGEHLVRGVKEIHFAFSPDPTLLALRDDGGLVACTYKKDPQAPVTAWHQADLGGHVTSAAVLDTMSGAVLRILAERADGIHVEDLPLHETGVDYLDSWASAVVSGAGEVLGLERFEGMVVRVKRDGAVVGDYPVAGGGVDGLVEHAGSTVVVGLPYRAIAKTLPREVKTGKARDVKVGALLAESALPLLNGRRPADRTPATPQNQVEPLKSGRFHLANLGWSDDGVVTLEQDLPVRTEVLALFAVTAQERV